MRRSRSAGVEISTASECRSPQHRRAIDAGFACPRCHATVGNDERALRMLAGIAYRNECARARSQETAAHSPKAAALVRSTQLRIVRETTAFSEMPAIGRPDPEGFRRKTDCEYYRSCLNWAVRAGLERFGCDPCPDYKPLPEKGLRDAADGIASSLTLQKVTEY